MASRKVVKKVTIKCVFCKNTLSVDKTIKAALCSHCVARLAGSPQEIGKFPKDNVVKTPKTKKVKKVAKKKVVKRKKVTASKPVSKSSGDNMKKFGGSPGRGWHLKKKFVAPNGNVYKFGQLVKKK
jgi:hypothetical protein